MSKKSDHNDHDPDRDNQDDKSDDNDIQIDCKNDPISRQMIEAIKNESMQEQVNTPNEILVENKENKENNANENNNEFEVPRDLRYVD